MEQAQHIWVGWKSKDPTQETMMLYKKSITRAAYCGNEDAQFAVVVHYCDGITFEGVGFPRNRGEARKVASFYESTSGYTGSVSPFSGLCEYDYPVR
jgi:hypothetical protein